MPDPTDRLCAKCNENPATENHSWCKPCKAKYQREYEALKSGLNRTRGFAQGVEALRQFLADEFERQGSGYFSGYECAAAIRRATIQE